MGRNKRSGRRFQHKNDDQKQKITSPEGEEKETNKQHKDDRDGYSITNRTNEYFINYYQKQGITPEGEWDEFFKALQTPLPSTFRITGFKSESREMLKIIKGEYLSNLVNVEVEDRVLEPPKCLPWYPKELAWQLSMERKFIRHCDELKKLHHFLVSETESGNISRQEAVSMIPPLLLDVKPHHKVLDMCAAPGSKTAQLIELLYADENIPNPDGFVIGNDSDNKRCYLMVHQVKRLQSPNFLVINHDASQLPNLREVDWNPNRNVNLLYDRVLADVPCSGDGTLRKNPDVWYKWNTVSGFNLHGLQARILKRGLEVLKVGGRLVYSTCSFNPIENEAVLANVLLRCTGTVELVEVSHLLPGLKHMNGLKTWKVMSKSGEWYEQWEEVPENLRTIIRPTMFPPTPEEADSLNLQHAIRVLPHHQDTGGFFIAVLEKKKRLPWMKVYNDDKVSSDCSQAGNGGAESSDVIDTNLEKSSAGDGEACVNEQGKPEQTGEAAEEGGGEQAAGTTGDIETQNGAEHKSKVERCRQKRKTQMERSGSPPPNKKQKVSGFREDPFLFLEPDDPVWPKIKSYFSVTDDFPVNHLLVRSGEGKKRNIYLTCAAVANLVKRNQSKVKFINMGVKVLNRSESKHVQDCDYRLVQEGVNSVYQFFTGRRVRLTPEDIVTILSEENPYINKLQRDTRRQLEDLGQGSMIYVYEPDERPDSPKCTLILTGWLGKVSTRTFVPKYERAHFLRLCGHELKTKEEKLTEKKAEEEKACTDQLEEKACTDQLEEKACTDQLEEKACTDQLEEKACTDQLEENRGDSLPEADDGVVENIEKNTFIQEHTESEDDKQNNSLPTETDTVVEQCDSDRAQQMQ